MIQPPSLQRSATLIWSKDPALVLPVDETERENALRVARETGNWQPILAGEPTRFVVRFLGGAAFRWLISESSRRKLTEIELAAMALRMAIEKIENWGDYQLELGRTADGFPLASAKLVDDLDAVDRTIVNELGTQIIERATPSPK